MPATEAENLKIAQSCPKRLGEGAKGVLVYVDEKSVALAQERVALLQNRVALVQETLGQNTFCILS